MKNVSWKNLMSNIKLISVAVIVLMALQMLMVVLLSHNRREERFNSRAGEAFSKAIVSMNEGINFMKEVALSTINTSDVYYTLYSPEVSPEALQRFRTIAGNVRPGLSIRVKNFFVYNDVLQTLYTTKFQRIPLHELPETKTKAEITRDVTKGDKMALFPDDEEFIKALPPEEQVDKARVLRLCYFPSRQSNSCLLLDIDMYNLVEVFKLYRDEFHSELFIMDEDEQFFYGSDTGLEAALRKDLTYLQQQNFDKPVFRRYEGERYLVLNRFSESGGLQIFSLIPESAIRVDYQETQTLLFTNLSLALAVCIVLIIFFILNKMNMAVKESSRHQLIQEQERLHNQFMRKKQHLANCLFQPSEQDIRMAKEYVDALLLDQDGNPGEMESWKEVAILRIEIYAYDTFREAHSGKDVLLYKYGIVNICEEILSNHLKALSIYERDAEIVFIAVPGEDFDNSCRKAIEECRKAVEEYIGVTLSAFLSRWGRMEELPELHSQTMQLSEYQFLLEEPVFLTAGFLDERSAVDFQEIQGQIEQICNTGRDIGSESGLAEMFAQLRDMPLDEAKNALWLLMFRLYNIGKKNARAVDNIESLVSHFNRIQRLSEMRTFFDGLYASVFSYGDNEDDKTQNHTVAKVREIIERRFTEPEFCSDSLAEEMNLSKAYLSRKYRQSAGISISETINERRLKEFAHMLLETDKSVKNIIDDIGGVNYNYYIIMFKKKYALTPTEYRKEFAQPESGGGGEEM